MSTSTIINLGILAHVDAGKTSLTERLLHAAGVIDEVGSVDDGSTRTDTLELERRRGITIKAAVVSFRVGDVTVNLIDTPGHPDFIAEVERALGVLDGAVLVVSAVEGVQAQTRVIFRALRRLRIPTLIFVNKIDRGGARHDETLRAIASRLTPAIASLVRTHDLGTPAAHVEPVEPATVVESLAEHDDDLLAAWLADRADHHTVRAALARQTARTAFHPVYFGSATTGAGVDALIDGITTWLPGGTGATDGDPHGTVFKIERGPVGEKIAFVRMRRGRLRVRDRCTVGAARTGDRITAITVFDEGTDRPADTLDPARIGRVWGLAAARIGDTVTVGPPGAPASGERIHFAPPTLETLVAPRDGGHQGRLYAALAQLAEQDPLIALRQDDSRGEIAVSLYGEVQKEVLEATLAADFDLAVRFRESTTICVERPRGTGEAAEAMAAGDNPFLATIGLRVDPAAEDSGVAFRLGVELGAMPLAFFTATEDTVRETLREGPHGWAVTDCLVTMTRSGYAPRQSHAHAVFDKSMSSTGADFRGLTPLVLAEALRRAGTAVCEPIHRFRLETPADCLPRVLAVLGRLGAVPLGSSEAIEGEMPAARVHEARRRLPGLTRGEGVLETEFARYRPVRGRPPRRPRTTADPWDRRDYLRRLGR